MMESCPHCDAKAACAVFKDARDGLGRLWDEWYCAVCDTAWEENVRSDNDSESRGPSSS